MFILEGDRSKFRIQQTKVKILIFRIVILIFLDRRQRQTMGLQNYVAANISEFKYQFQAQVTTDLDAHFGQH